MASRNGIAISNIPFEQRCQTPSRRKRERLTLGDRMVLALCGGLLGLFLWTVGYVILFFTALKVEAKVAARPHVAIAGPVIDPADRLPPYWWGAWAALAFAGYGSLVGAERMMDGFETGMRWLGKFAEEANRQQ